MQKALTDNSSAKFSERYSIQEEYEKKRCRNRAKSEWRESNIGNCIWLQLHSAYLMVDAEKRTEGSMVTEMGKMYKKSHLFFAQIFFFPLENALTCFWSSNKSVRRRLLWIYTDDTGSHYRMYFIVSMRGWCKYIVWYKNITWYFGENL